MRYDYYVYFLLDCNRLVITAAEVADDNYLFMVNCYDSDKASALHACKMYCAGFIVGSKNGHRQVTNKMEEFI
jgi:hypothetical protein